MGASANVVAAFLLLSVVMAVPTGGPQRHKFEGNKIVVEERDTLRYAKY
ncbi:unnamed protein product [Plutella xylostella]|uniref:(diamondback moth) hypothetical protein n=1 Tax=Plutella xylostella TaxID=51655 RepID=A0A8S4FXP4_PLUXY|nr:unnamed protein product [Plutella xylostella]